MIDISTNLVTKLSTVLPTYYELFLDKSAAIPCYSYQIINNTETALGNTLGYSSITVRVKVWAKNMTDIVSYSAACDNALATIGRFTRTASNEIEQAGLICRILDYQVLVKEIYNNTRG